MKPSAYFIAFLFTATSVLAEIGQLEFSISPSVTGIKEGTPLTFRRTAVVLNESIPISAGSQLQPPFTSAQDLLLTGTWLQQTGNTSDYRLHIGHPKGLSAEYLKLMTSDALLKNKQDLLQKYSTFEPLLLIKGDTNDVLYLIYRLKGAEDSVIYISSVAKDAEGSYAYVGGELSSNEIMALFNGLVQENITNQKCVSIIQD